MLVNMHLDSIWGMGNGEYQHEEKISPIAFVQNHDICIQLLEILSVI